MKNIENPMFMVYSYRWLPNYFRTIVKSKPDRGGPIAHHNRMEPSNLTRDRNTCVLYDCAMNCQINDVLTHMDTSIYRERNYTPLCARMISLLLNQLSFFNNPLCNLFHHFSFSNHIFSFCKTDIYFLFFF